MSRGALHVTERCRPATETFQLIGDKWTMMVVMQFWEGGRRFSELRRDLPGISQRMLTLTLRNLERDGLIQRTVTPTVPPRVDYALTQMGQAFGQATFPIGQGGLRKQGGCRSCARNIRQPSGSRNRARLISPARTLVWAAAPRDWSNPQAALASCRAVAECLSDPDSPGAD